MANMKDFIINNMSKKPLNLNPADFNVDSMAANSYVEFVDLKVATNNVTTISIPFLDTNQGNNPLSQYGKHIEASDAVFPMGVKLEFVLAKGGDGPLSGELLSTVTHELPDDYTKKVASTFIQGSTTFFANKNSNPVITNASVSQFIPAYTSETILFRREQYDFENLYCFLPTKSNPVISITLPQALPVYTSGDVRLFAKFTLEAYTTTYNATR
jgi:hypothetical protein